MTDSTAPADAAVTADASAIIALLEEADAHHDAVVDVLAGVSILAIHPVNLAEVLTAYPDDEHQAVIDSLEEVFTLAVQSAGDPNDEAKAIASLRRATGLRITDVCALAVATELGPLLTFDAKQAERARKAGIDVITNPTTY